MIFSDFCSYYYPRYYVCHYQASEERNNFKMIYLYYNYTFEKKWLFLGLKRKSMKFWLNMLQPLLLRPLHLTHGAHWGSLNFSQFGT